MKRSLYSSMCISMLVAAGIMVTGCGVGKKTVAAYETQLKALEAKGVPDSILSSVRVYLAQIKSGKESGLGTVVKTSSDSVKKFLAEADAWYQASLKTAKPRVDSLVKSFIAAKAALSGLQLKDADSMLGVINSYTKQNWYMQAQTYADNLDTLMPLLLKDEVNAKKADAQIRGTVWNMSKKITDNGANAVQKGRVSFVKDGSYEMSEEMKGLTKPGLKEDWLFLSWGTFTMKGDTILFSTKREKRVRQIYQHLTEKKQWQTIEDKPYDSTFTDGSKDRFFTFEYLKENFKR